MTERGCDCVYSLRLPQKGDMVGKHIVMVLTKPIYFHMNVKFPAFISSPLNVTCFSSVLSRCLKLDDGDR